jgi:hypothetical protein
MYAYLVVYRKKIALITMRGNGLLMVIGNPKKLALMTMRGNGLLMVVGNPKRMRVLPCF